MSNTILEVFDKTNKQIDYQFIAETWDGKTIAGWIVIEQPWYSNKSDWVYWIVSNEYGGGGICGGAVDLGLKKVAINPGTIRPYTQIEKIKWCLNDGLVVKLVNEFYIFDEEEPPNNVLAIIHNKNEIPFELWK